MVNINQKNFNNPENLQLSDSYSVISATLDNPYVPKAIDYADFRSSDPVLNNMLPKVVNVGHNNGNANNMKDVFNWQKNLNLGLTSPGFVDDAMKCSGLDYVNTNPDYDKLPFQVCLDKFSDQYKIPEMTFNNLMNNLPYTFSALSPDEQKRYLSSLKNFIDTESKKNNLKENFINNDNENTNQNDNDTDIKEYFGKSHDVKCSDSGLSLSGILTIIIVIIIIIVFLLFIANKN